MTVVITIAAGLSLSACGRGGGATGASSAPAGANSTPITVNPLPTASLTASPAALTTGGAATLTWSSTNATACTASGGWSGALAPEGTRSTGALASSTSYSITCTGAGGSSKVETAAVTVAAPPPVPTATLTAAPAAVSAGAAAVLTWSSSNATACTGTGGTFAGARATSGSVSTGALTATTAYSLTCSGAGGASNAATATVTVTPVIAPTVTLAANPNPIAAGAAATLTWSSTNATACTATGGWSGAQLVTGTQSTGPLSVPTLYSLSCTGAGGAASAAVTVNVIPGATLTAQPSVIASGGASTLTWSSTNATACAGVGGTFAGPKATSGSVSTGALTATTPYSLTCTGAGGTSLVATATVTIANGAVTLAPKVAAITSSQTQQFTATVPGGGGAAWSVDGVAGGNGAVGLVSSSGLYTPGTAVGVHTVLAASLANSAQTGSATVAVTDLAGIYTQHGDLARDGANLHEFALTPGNVNTASFGKRFSCIADGAIYAQPLWVANLTVNGAQHNVVLVATQHDSLFAFDADASPCVTLWQASLIDAAHGGTAGETTVPAGPVGHKVGNGDGDISPEVGITGTPVIDPATGPNTATLYVVTKSMNAGATAFYQRLHAIDLTTGAEKPGSPVLIAATYPGTGDGSAVTTFDPRMQAQRPGLSLLNGVVSIAWASHEDATPYHGWVMGYTYNGTAFAQASVLNVTPNGRQGGIWMSGGAMAGDANNFLYLLTGNGDFAPASNNYGDSLLRLTGSLAVSSYFTPSDQAQDQGGDQDFGSGGAAVLADLPAGNPVTHLVLGGGKDGTLYVLNRDALGGSGDANAHQHVALGRSIFSTGAFWNNSFYIAAAGGTLNAYSLNPATATISPSSPASSTQVFNWPGGTPSVSAAGAQSGVVWILDTSQYCTKPNPKCGPAVLHAYDATNVQADLWNSGQVSTDAAGFAVKFTVPTIANGKVYVGTRGNNIGGVTSSTSVPGELDVYGLIPN